jgi:23S rRNA (cytosine1962-C5)-methyltransferase
VGPNARGYELLDAGDGRRLERFGPVVVDRPAPGATERPRLTAERWRRADATFDRDRGWAWPTDPPADWTIELDDIVLELRPADGGQVGVFPEHAGMWPWLRERCDGGPIMNLFAYTGATTLAVARAGASLVHVDAARTAVAWARENAELSGLADAPIRWLVDDAAAFVAREGRRGRRYRGIVLDPPSYGYGGGGRTWRVQRDLPSLLAGCRALLDGPAFVLLTSHTPELTPSRLARLVEVEFGGPVAHGELVVHARTGARLSLGSYARWERPG